MKKLLGTTLALAMFIPAGANAELLKNFKVSGNLDIQTTSARNVTDFVTRPTGANSSPANGVNHDRIGHATTRVIVKLDWDILDDVHSRVTLVKGAQSAVGNARVYGDARVSGNAQVYGNAWVYGDAQVSGTARVYGTARVFGDARVSGAALVSGTARVFGDAQVHGAALVLEGDLT